MIHTFLLTVTDKDNNIYTDTISITVRDLALKPLTADAGSDQIVDSSDTVTLDGSNSYVRFGVNVTYTWHILENPWIEITNANQISASFVAPVVVSTYYERYKTYTAQLTITDTDNNTYTDTVNIDVNRQVSTINAPVARITPNTLIVSSGETVTLSGSNSSDFEDGSIASYAWERIGGLSNEPLVFSGENTDTLTFTAETLTSNDIPTNYIIRLIVKDNDDNSDDENITVTVNPPSSPTIPTLMAHTGPNIYSYSGGLVQLDGSGSTGTSLTYLWERIGGTGNSNINLSDPTIAQPAFSGDIVTSGPGVTHLYRLTVTDTTGATDSAEIKITIYPIP